MLILSKINKGKYIDDMYENEYLYFNSLKGFRGSDIDGSGRFDPRELNLNNEQLTTLTIVTDKEEIHFHEVFEKFSGQFMEHLSDPKINCCSLHWMEIEPEKPSSTYNEKLLDMGDKTLLILDAKRFFEILDESIEREGFKFRRRKVTYYDPKTHSGNLTLHHKDIKLSWQNEYRILIAPTQNEPIRIDLPGLREICYIIQTVDLDKFRIRLAQPPSV